MIDFLRHNLSNFQKESSDNLNWRYLVVLLLWNEMYDQPAWKEVSWWFKTAKLVLDIYKVHFLKKLNKSTDVNDHPSSRCNECWWYLKNTGNHEFTKYGLFILPRWFMETRTFIKHCFCPRVITIVTRLLYASCTLLNTLY